MIITKFIDGYVVQNFNVQTGKCTSQRFVADNKTEYRSEDGRRVEDGPGPNGDGYNLYHPFDMKQPPITDVDKPTIKNPDTIATRQFVYDLFDALLSVTDFIDDTNYLKRFRKAVKESDMV